MAAEKKVENSIKAYVKALKPYAKMIKFHGSQYTESGTPDLHMTINGVSVWLEVKAPGEVPTKLQEKRIEEWRAAGAVAEYVDSFEDFLDLLECLPSRLPISLNEWRSRCHSKG